MDYLRIYYRIIDNAQVHPVVGYSERHHIIPRCMDGSNDPINLVRLSPRAHFICHWLLTKIFPDTKGLQLAFWFMVQTSQESKVSHYRETKGRLYQRVREQISCTISGLRTGMKFSHTHRHNLRLSHIGIRPTDEARTNHRRAMNQPETKIKLRAARIANFEHVEAARLDAICKSWKATAPDGTIYTFRNLRAFARERATNPESFQSGLKQVAAGKFTQFQGWTCIRLEGVR